MKTNAPKKITWFIGLIVGALGVLGYFVHIPFVSLHLFWFLAVGWLIFVLATCIKGL